MSKFLSPVAQQEFDNLVHHVYQAGYKLDGCCRLKSDVTGDAHKFRTMGKGLANQKASQADVTPMDVAHSLIPATLQNWNAPEYTDIFDAAEVGFDEKSELAKTISKALGRRKDQLLIDALDASTPTATVATSIGGAATPMNIAKVAAAGSELDDNEVDEEGRVMLLSSKSKWSLLQTTEVGSADYNTVKALAHGEIDTFMGFKFVFMGTRGEGGLTAAATVYDGYAFHMDALGLAVGIQEKTEINYVPHKTSWLANGILKAGAVAIDETGIVKVQATQA